MSSPTIVRELCDFLSQYPPFSFLDEAELAHLASKTSLEYFETGEILFQQNAPPLAHFFLVKKGSIEIRQEQMGEEVLVDACDEGDVFGIRASLGADHYIATAKAAEDSLLYAIPIQVFKEEIVQNPEVALFLAAGFASGISIFRPEELKQTQAAHKALMKPLYNQQFIAQETLEIHPKHELIHCALRCSVQEVAQMMTRQNVGSMLITDEARKPLGIVTDTDFRKKVVALDQPIKQLGVERIMTHPVHCIPPKLTTTEIMLAMVRLKVSHLCITEDGTPNSPALSVISQRDVLVTQGNNPAILAKELIKTRSLDKIQRIRAKAEQLVQSYLQQEVSIAFISHIITEINDILIHKAVEMSEQKLAKAGWQKPEQAFCWLSLGSEGRKEQLLRTDQDNALVYEDPPKEQADEVRAYFLELAKEVTEILMHAGFEKCPADMMGSNPKWCQPLSGWQQYFHRWIQQPADKEIMYSTIFFDFRPVYGAGELANALKQYIFQQLEKQSIFLSFLARNALQNPPPLSFFRNFIVEKSGDHQNEFDIKARAMMPLVDAARVLSYDLRLEGYYSTAERFRELARRDKKLKELCEPAAMCYELLIRKRAFHGLQNQNSGRFINPNDFNKLERQTLRNVFKLIERLQKMLEVRYRLNLFG